LTEVPRLSAAISERLGRPAEFVTTYTGASAAMPGSAAGRSSIEALGPDRPPLWRAS